VTAIPWDVQEFLTNYGLTPWEMGRQPPEDFQQALKWEREINGACAHIQAQLSERNAAMHQEKADRGWVGEEQWATYLHWRARAIRALEMKRLDYRALQRYRAEQWPSGPRSGAEPKPKRPPVIWYGNARHHQVLVERGLV